MIMLGRYIYKKVKGNREDKQMQKQQQNGYPQRQSPLAQQNPNQYNSQQARRSSTTPSEDMTLH